MKIFIKGSDENISLVKEAISETFLEWSEGGLTIELKKTDKGLKIESDGQNATVYYSTKASLLRAIGVLATEKGAFIKEEEMRFNLLGNMVDCSRNAVITVETFKKLVRMCSLMGHNCIMLYTEDTYEIEGEKYFGRMRGRYTKAEFKEMDAYAEKFGMELIPCIQTLAHLDCMFNWPQLRSYNDISNILNVAKEETYTLIDKMLKTMSENLKSRRINIGMDEAHLLGRGNYIKSKGYKERSEIMKEHLKRVVELCKKYGYEPLMWGDMFFRMNSPTGGYYDAEITPEIAAIVPPEVNIVYWNYTFPNIEPYADMIKKHRAFNNKISFAGGAFTWYGAVPQTAYAMSASRSALQAMFNDEEIKMDTVLITEWGDQGGYNSILSALPTMVLYGEGAWSGDISLETLDKRMALFGETLADFLAMDDLDYTPDIEHIRYNDVMLTHIYMLYNDALQGIWNWHIPENTREYFGKTAKKLQAIADKNTPLSHLFVTLSKLASVLELKADLSLRIRDAYDKGDKAELRRIALDEIPEIIKRAKDYAKAFRYQWRKVNKDFGLEVFDTRLGGLLLRLEDVAEELIAYCDGQRAALPELHEECLPFWDAEEKGTPKSCFYWWEAVTSGRLRD